MTIRGFCLSVVSLVSLLAAAPRAEAAYVITLSQVGSDVVATGSGSIDLTDLGNPDSASWSAVLFGAGAGVWVGSSAPVDVYSGASGPTSFGTINPSNATGATGTVTGIWGQFGIIDVPAGYASGTFLSGTGTWSNETIDSLGLTAGTYVWNWGSGDHADTFTVNIVADVPEPSSIALLGLPLAFGLIRRRRRA